MKIIFVRHGESMANAGLLNLGKDNGLSHKGEDQAQKLAQYLWGEKIRMIYCSPSLRCQQTLEFILENRDDEVDVHLSQLVKPKKLTETKQGVEKRLRIFLDDLKYEIGEDETVVVISHMAPIKLMVKLLTGEERFIDNASVSEIKMKDGTAIDWEINLIEFL